MIALALSGKIFLLIGRIQILMFRKNPCLLYTSDAADERSSVDLGGRRIIKKKNKSIIGAVASEKRKRE